MPDLETVSESEDSVMITLIPTDSTCSIDDNNKRDLSQFSNDEMVDLVEDSGCYDFKKLSIKSYSQQLS